MNDIYMKTTTLNKWAEKYFKNQDLVSIDDLLQCIEELDGEVDHLKEQLQDLEQDIKDNYKRIPVSEQIGISDKDFM